MSVDHRCQTADRRRGLGVAARLVSWIALALTAGPTLGEVELYAKKDSLQQTMLATRARLQQWRTAQLDARQAVKADPWRGITLGGVKLDGVELSKNVAPPASVTKSALPSWNPWSGDGSGGIFSVETLPGDFLVTTVRAERPLTLTLELSRYEWFG
jgi:hypothetical protein